VVKAVMVLVKPTEPDVLTDVGRGVGTKTCTKVVVPSPRPSMDVTVLVDGAEVPKVVV
jgi:hypothetical protein